MIHKYSILLVFLLFHVMLSGQENETEVQKPPVTPKLALETFRQGEYAEAYEMYKTLIIKYPKYSKINYYLGICELKTNQNIPDAIKHLKYASLRGVGNDVYYYLGRAYQLNYNFKEAISSFKRFLKYAKPNDIRKEKAEQYMKESEEGEKISAKIYYLQVVGKDTVPKDMFLSMYHPVKDAGYILYNKDFFESGVDPNGIMYLTERKDEVFFSMPVDTTNRFDIFKMEKLIDGWSKPVNLKGVNSQYDDLYPFLKIDGVTLYFSSNRPGGLGGFDIYKTTYDPDSKTFTQPVNMGIPFNSPRDDYFLVTDEFSGVAWFTSNRNTTGNEVMVYQIIWDNSVVKNMVYEENDVRIAATMPLLKNIPEKIKKLRQQQQNSVVSTEKEALFHFKVTDKVTYTDFNQFQSKEALQIFKEGFALQQKKDSLSLLMKEKRKKYSITDSPDEKAKLVNEILTLEKQVYGLDSKINDFYYQARSIERPIVEKLVSKGIYKLPDAEPEKSNAGTDIDEILIPGNYTFYTDEEFRKKLLKLDGMYQKLFDPETVARLRHADSLYVWGNILSLESSKLLEQANKPQNTEIQISSVFRENKEAVNTEPDRSAGLISKARELQNTALKLYHNSLDTKFSIFKEKIKEIILSHPTDDFTFMEERQEEANAYFRQANDDITRSITFNPEQYEKEGALKREAVNLQEDALFLYKSYLEGDTSVIDSLMNKGIKESAVTENKENKATAGNKASNEATNAKGLEYRIQIGVFKNEPKEESLKKIPPVSSISLPDKELIKYFSGHFKTYEEAEKHLTGIREAGFPGAFIVAFYNGQLISLSKAKELKH